LHPNRNAPGDSTLVSGRQSTPANRAAYAEWLQRLRSVCTERGIALIFDEVFVGFRLARGGAQEHYGVQADFVTYGKTLGGGLPVGVVCGRATWMQRFRAQRPADICFARGTFNAHPYVMGAMNAFLRRLDTDAVRGLYEGLDERWQQRLAGFNQVLQRADLPVRMAGLSSIWTVNFTTPSRYHWMLQFYLREQGLALSWVGTGRLVFTLAHTDDDMADIARRFVLACQQMRTDGWWTVPAGKTGKDFGRQILREMWRAR
jgi:glutamate-1-semialdehyde 2,1-aminomutase